MFTIKKISKLRSLIFLVLLAVIFLPLLGFMAVNLPQVVGKMTEVEQEKQTLLLMSDFDQVRQTIERRKESMRILSLVPGIRDLVGNDNVDVPYELVLKRLTDMLISWFSRENDVVGISIIDQYGQEKLRLQREKQQLVSVSAASAITEYQAEGFRETRIRKPGEFLVANIRSKLRPIGEGHVHYLIFYVGMPIAADKIHENGVILLELDFKKLLPRKGIDYLINGIGTCYVDSTHHVAHQTDVHQHRRDTLFDDFKDLEKAMEKEINFVTADKRGKTYAWARLIVDDDPKNCLWAGTEIDRTMIRDWIHGFLEKFVLIFCLFSLLIIYVANRLAISGDRLKKELTAGLEGLLDHNKPLELNWSWPMELHDLGQDLNVLSSRYLEISAHRNQVELELMAVNKRLEMILNSIAEGIMGLDYDGAIIFANLAAVKMFGFADVDDLLGNDLHSLVHFLREDRSQYPAEDCPFCQALKNNKVEIEAEDIFWKHDNDKIYVQYLASPIYAEDGKVVGTVMCIRDISESKLAEEQMDSLRKQLLQAQKMEAIGTLAGGVAHDFNNLLTHITGYSDIMLMEIPEDHHLRKHIKIVQDAAQRAGGLTRQLLTFSRKQSMLPQVIDLNMLVQNIDKMLRRFIGENITLRNHLSNRSTVVNVDPGMIEQVLMNLVINARDALPDGGRITIETEVDTVKENDLKNMPQGRVGDFVRLGVADNGIGIAKNDLEKIFDPFFTTKGLGKGTGLGLSVVYGIIQQHQGWITVSSVPGEGTEFSIYLPEYKGAEKDGGEISQDILTPGQGEISRDILTPGQGERILMLEDEKNVRDVTEKILQMNGYKVFSAETVEEGLALFAKENGRFELVFSDIVLPDGTGLQFVERILAESPEMKVLMTSGYSDDMAQMSLIKQRKLAFVQKPYGRTQLLDAVHKVFTVPNR